jgi:hypothetical protein
MKVSEPQNKQINERLQQVYSAVNSQQVSGENELSSQLMEEFARILDKIAATVADIKKSNVASDLVVSDEFFADLNQVTEFHFKPEQNSKKSDKDQSEESEQHIGEQTEELVQPTKQASDNKIDLGNEEKENKADNKKEETVEEIEEDNVQAKDSNSNNNEEKDNTVDVTVVSAYAQTQIKANNVDKDLKLVEKSEVKIEQKVGDANQNVDQQISAQSESNKDSLDFTKQELNKIAAKLGKQFTSNSTLN